MAKKAEKEFKVEDQIKALDTALREMFSELFGECLDIEGVIRARVEHMGVTDSTAIVDAVLEPGLRQEAPYGVLHFVVTLAENIPDESLADLLISLNGLNHVVGAGSYPGFGSFCYYEPLNQVYLNYRMPVNLMQLEGEFDNIRYYLGTLYDQLDIFTDFIMFTLANPGSMDISDYMQYLDDVSDLNDMEGRVEVFREEFERLAKDHGLDADEIEAVDVDTDTDTNTED